VNLEPLAGLGKALVDMLGTEEGQVVVVCMPAAGMPAAGMPAAGMPAAGMPAAGMPAAGMPAAGVLVGPREDIHSWVE